MKTRKTFNTISKTEKVVFALFVIFLIVVFTINETNNKRVVFLGTNIGIFKLQGAYQSLVKLQIRDDKQTLTKSMVVESLALSPTFAVDKTVLVSGFIGHEIVAAYSSLNGGRTWTEARKLDNNLTRSFVFSPDYKLDSTVFAIGRTVDRGAIYKSIKNMKWVDISKATRTDKRKPVAFTGIGLSPSFKKDGNVFVGGYFFDEKRSLLLKSNNSGRDWSKLEKPIEKIRILHDITVSPGYNNDQTVFVGGYDDKKRLILYKSRDKGKTWARLEKGLRNIKGIQMSIALSPDYATDNTVFVISTSSSRNRKGLIMKSTNGGRTWKQVGARLPEAHIRAIALDPDFAENQTILVGGFYMSGAFLYKSSNGGQNWINQKPALGYGVGIDQIEIATVN